MIIVKDQYQGELNRIVDKSLEEVKKEYRTMFPLTFEELTFEEIKQKEYLYEVDEFCSY